MFDFLTHFPTGLNEAQLDSARSWFNILLVGANVVVWLGVILEAKRFPEKVQNWGWAVLVVGLGIETLSAVLLWQVDTAIIKKQGATTTAIASVARAAKADAGQAITDAREAKSQLAGLSDKEAELRNSLAIDENARRAMVDQLKTRDITKAQVQLIKDAVKGHTSKIYLYMLCDPEAFSYALEMETALQQAGYAVNDVFANPLGSGKAICFDKFEVQGIPSTGLSLLVYPSAVEEADGISKLMEAMVKAKLDIVSMSSPASPEPAFHPALFVGLKAPAFQQFPKLRMPPALEKYLAKHPPPWNPH